MKKNFDLIRRTKDFDKNESICKQSDDIYDANMMLIMDGFRVLMIVWSGAWN